MGPPLLIFAILFWSVMLGAGIYAVRRLLGILERRTQSTAELAALQQRVAALEEALDDVRGSVERLDAGQEFTTRLLGARPGRGDQAT